MHPSPEPAAPTDVETAMAHYQAGRQPQAFEICRRILEREPEHATALQLLGVLQLQSGSAAEAVAALRRSHELQPAAAGTLLPLGTALRATGDEAGAEVAYRRLIELAPGLPEGPYALGRLLADTGRRREAAAQLELALQLRPGWAEALNELGIVHLRGTAGEPDGAKAAELFRRAIELAPDWVTPHHNLGEALDAAGELAAAMAAYEAVLSRWPDFEPSRRNLAYGLLKLGRFEAGWQAHEWRFAAGGRTPPREGWDAEVWDGSPFHGRTLVVWTEQGLGDHLQFVRYLPRVAALGGRVWLQSPEPLARLMTTCPGVDRVVVGDPPAAAVDLQVPLLTLPNLFGTTLATIPSEIPYLRPPATIPYDVGQRLAARGHGLRVGLVWKSGTQAPRHGARDLGAAEVRRLLNVPGVRWFALQYGERLADLVGEAAVADGSITDLGPEIGDFAATAAVVDALDLMITVDTAALHLAGALGKNVWALIPEPADWRWMVERQDSPWYPTLRLFRQERPGDWSDPLARVVGLLEDRLR